MFKAVFFDWFNTLAVYYPPREELQSRAIRENGYNISLESVKPALFAADRFLFDENATSPIRLRSKSEQKRLYSDYEDILLREAGIDTAGDPELGFKIYRRAAELYGDIGFKLYDDVIPTIRSLRDLGYSTGIITNITIEMEPVCEELGLLSFLDVIVTSAESGFDKPKPEIFLAALAGKDIKPDEAIHVGDQYNTDVVGARNAGFTPLFLDRFGDYPEVTDCHRITTLSEVIDYLKTT